MYSIEQMTRIYRIASQRSFWRGFDYAQNGFAEIIGEIAPNRYQLKVRGSRKEPYNVVIDTEKIKKSTCDCPRCQDHPTYFCKHKVAAYFAIFKDEFENARNFIEQIEKENQKMQDEYYEKLENAEKEMRAKVNKIVEQMSKEELKEELTKMMVNSAMKDIENDLYSEYEDYLDLDYED